METYPCFSKFDELFLACKFSSDLVANRLFCRDADVCMCMGECAIKSPVEFQRLPKPVGLFWLLKLLLCVNKFVADVCDCSIADCIKAVVECTVAGRGSGDGAGDTELLLCESAEWRDPFDWWCSMRLFKFVLFGKFLEGEFVVLLLLLRLKRQSSNVDVICGERTKRKCRERKKMIKIDNIDVDTRLFSN